MKLLKSRSEKALALISQFDQRPEKHLLNLSQDAMTMTNTSGTNGAGILRNCIQSIPENHGWAMISSTPLRPSLKFRTVTIRHNKIAVSYTGIHHLFEASVTSLFKKSTNERLKASNTVGGISKYCFHLNILRHVSVGVLS
jgi:hypothetical protein